MKKRLHEEEQQPKPPVEIHFYHCDHLGTPIALTDRNHHVIWAAKLDPWGNLEEEYNPNRIDQPIRLPGQHHDRETGLYYNRHRYYDPTLGSYINQDPIGGLGGENGYRYPGNPQKSIDPLGLFEVCASNVMSGDGPKTVYTFSVMPSLVNNLRQKVEKIEDLSSGLLPKSLRRVNKAQQIQDKYDALTCSGGVDSEKRLQAAACDAIVDDVLKQNGIDSGIRASATQLSVDRANEMLVKIRSELNKTEGGKNCSRLYDWNSIIPNATNRATDLRGFFDAISR